MKKFIISAAIAATAMLPASPSFAGDMPGESIFVHNCKMCHSLSRKKVGPAVKSMNKDPSVLKQTITNGRGMMPRFSHKLTTEQINQVVAYLQSVQGK